MQSWPSLTIFRKFKKTHLDVNIFSRMSIGHKRPIYRPNGAPWCVMVITAAQLNKVPDGNKSERLSFVSYPTKKINHHHLHRHHRQDIF